MRLLRGDSGGANSVVRSAECGSVFVSAEQRDQPVSALRVYKQPDEKDHQERHADDCAA